MKKKIKKLRPPTWDDDPKSYTMVNNSRKGGSNVKVQKPRN